MKCDNWRRGPLVPKWRQSGRENRPAGETRQTLAITPRASSNYVLASWISVAIQKMVVDLGCKKVEQRVAWSVAEGKRPTGMSISRTINRFLLYLSPQSARLSWSAIDWPAALLPALKECPGNYSLPAAGLNLNPVCCFWGAVPPPCDYDLHVH